MRRSAPRRQFVDYHNESAIGYVCLSTAELVGVRRCGPGYWSRRPAPAPTAGARPRPPAPPASYERVLLTAGRSTVLATDFDITRIAITNPAIADAVVVQPREILIDGKAPGTVSLIVWGGGRAEAVRYRRRSRRGGLAAAVPGAVSG